MPRSVQRVGDANVVGGTILTGDYSVLVNFRPIATIGASVTPHPCCGAKGCPPIHCFAKTIGTSASVLVNGRPVVVTGDKDSCGHARGTGSLNVFVG